MRYCKKRQYPVNLVAYWFMGTTVLKNVLHFPCLRDMGSVFLRVAEVCQFCELGEEGQQLVKAAMTQLQLLAAPIIVF